MILALVRSTSRSETYAVSIVLLHRLSNLPTLYNERSGTTRYAPESLPAFPPVCSTEPLSEEHHSLTIPRRFLKPVPFVENSHFLARLVLYGRVPGWCSRCGDHNVKENRCWLPENSH